MGLWHKLFLQERPSIGLSFFRIFAALTTGLHVIPSFFHLKDNYFSSALKTLNYNFFTPGIIDLVQKSSDTVVVVFVVIFLVSWLFFLVGFLSQISCILMVLSCYYFYALNAFHIGTLSWDILLVTLFLMCITEYHGDYFSVDCLLRRDPLAYKRKRPYFLQRLLQMQIACTYFYTALYKITAKGNWLNGNPVYSLMHYPQEGVTKSFFLREFMAGHPKLCYIAGIMIVATELAMPILLFCRKTRVFAICLGLFFHILLILTLHVPTIFFFLFPPQLLLFVNSEKIIQWIDQKRKSNENLSESRSRLIFDGNCQFCRRSVEVLQVMDLFKSLDYVDYQQVVDLSKLNPGLAKDKAHSQIHLIDHNGKLYGGFAVFRKICLFLPMLYPVIPVFYFPGMNFIGPVIYNIIAKNRYLFHFHTKCKNNACFRP